MFLHDALNLTVFRLLSSNISYVLDYALFYTLSDALFYALSDALFHTLSDALLSQCLIRYARPDSGI